VKGFKVPWT